MQSQGAGSFLQVLNRPAFLRCKYSAGAVPKRDLLHSMADGLGIFLPRAADGDEAF